MTLLLPPVPFMPLVARISFHRWKGYAVRERGHRTIVASTLRRPFLDQRSRMHSYHLSRANGELSLRYFYVRFCKNIIFIITFI